MAHLERGDPGLLAVARLELGNQTAAFVAQGDELVEVGRVAAGDEPAVAGNQWQIGRERAGEPALSVPLDEAIEQALGLGVAP